MKKDKAPRNKTIELTKAEINQYAKKTLKISAPIALDFVLNKTLLKNLNRLKYTQWPDTLQGNSEQENTLNKKA